MNARNFFERVLKTEAEVLTNNTVPDLDVYNQSVEELLKFIQGEIEQRISPGKRSRLLSDRFYKQKINYIPRLFFKLSQYENNQYGTLWVAYLSRTNPTLTSEKTPYHEAFFAVTMNNELKIIAAMSVALRESDMKPIGWKSNMYNPPNFEITNLGDLVSIERFLTPIDDGFSLEEHLKDQ